MLLRSSSTPILNSCISLLKDSALEADLNPPIPRSGSITQLPRLFSLNASSRPASPGEEHGLFRSKKKVPRTLSQTELRDLSRPTAAAKGKPLLKNPNRKKLSSVPLEEAKTSERSYPSTASLGQLFSSSGLDECCCFVDDGPKKKGFPGLLPCDGFGSGGGAGIGSGEGGGGGRDGDGGSGSWDSNNGNDSTDLHYQKMIEADPGNGLLLANYARFLKEVRGDLERAEEYCGRAILANPGDGDILSLYADLVWQIHKDMERAESYFNQAMEAAPDNCYVSAAYARFAWETDEDEEGKEKDATPSFLQEPSHVTAASY